MAISRPSRRIQTIIIFGVAVPAMMLAALSIHLTVRIARAVEADAIRYHSYLAQQVAEAYEQDLMDHLRRSIGLAENAARTRAGVTEILASLEAGTTEFEGVHFVPIDSLNDHSLIIVQSQPLLFAPGTGRHAGQYFAGLLLRNGEAEIGAGGWWIDPRKFLVAHLNDVLQERLPSNPRMYGGLEATLRLSVELHAPDGTVIAKVRDPGSTRIARSEPFSGPFEGYSVRVASTANAPVVWAGRFVALESAFIALMGLLIVGATIFGLRYTIRQLELAQLKSSFVSNVTHELKTPIALIRLASETIELGRYRTEEERGKFMRSIGRETQRLSQLVDNILDFARLEAGQHAFRFENVDVAEVVRETLESFRPRLEHQSFQVEVDIPDQLPLVRADPTALTHCVLNLLDNAIKYSRERREVKVAVASRGDTVGVSVADHGIGIDPDDQARIFEKFVRLETGLVHDVKGAGLGLSLVDQIMRAHHGRVEVASTPGGGSTFTLVIPAVARSAEQPNELRDRTA